MLIDSGAMLQIGVLGSLVAHVDDARVDLGGHKQRTVLAALALARGRVVSLDALIDDLWGDEPPPAATSTLQGYVSHLRKALEPSRAAADRRVLVTEAPGYALHLAEEQFDVGRYEGMLRDAERLASTDVAAARSMLDRAEALWRGPAYAEFAHLPAAVAETARLNELRHAAWERRAELLLGEGSNDAAVAALEAIVVELPYRERPRELLMLALHRSGRQADALRLYANTHATFVDELGLTPGRALRDMERRILDQDETLDVEGVVAPTRSPVDVVADEPVAEPVSGTDRRLLVGRADELDRLLTAAADSRTGATRFVLIGGEPGIGKSRLAEELDARLASDGWAVAWGRCHDDEGAPPLWSIGSVLRGLGAHTLDDLADLAPDDNPWRLYAAIADELVGAARIRPTCVVIDDLHWADTGALRFLTFLATELRDEPLLVVCTFRTTEWFASDDTVASLTRTPGSVRIDLDGLSLDAVGTYVSTTVGQEVSDAVATGIRERTGGNPFFIGELARLLTSERRLADASTETGAVPASVRDVVTSRLERLPQDSQAVLDVAAVAGRVFRVDDLEAICGLSADELDDALDAAIVTSVVQTVESDAGDMGQLRFAHAIVQETVYEAIAPRRRARLHGRMLTTIEAGTDAAKRAGELAHHAERAGDLAKLARYSALAATQAEHVRGYHEAVHHWTVARSALSRSDAPPHEQLPAAIGEVRAWRLAGDMRRSTDALANAAQLADSTSDPAALAEVASAFGGFSMWQWRPYGEYDLAHIELLRRAVATTGTDDAATRARLLSALAIEGYYAPSTDGDSGEQIASAALAEARRTADPEVLASALNAYVIACWNPGGAPAQLVAAEELTAMSGDGIRPEISLVGRLHRMGFRLMVGDATGLSREIDDCVALAHELRQPTLITQALWLQAMVASMRGDYLRTMEIANAAHPLHAALGYTDPDIMVGLLEFEHRWLEGGLAELRPLLELGDAIEMFGTVKLMVALCALDAGDHAEASRLLEECATPPDDWLGLFHACLAAEVAARLGHHLARDLRAWLAPYAETVVLVGSGSICLGSVHHFLGLLAAAEGDDRATRRHLERAASVNESIGAPRWAERSRRTLDAL